MKISSASMRRRISRTLVTAIVVGLIQIIVGPTPANASGTPTVTPPSTSWVIAAGAESSIPGFSVGGLAVSDTYLVTISLNTTASGTLKIATKTNLYPSYSYSTSTFDSFSKVTFTGLAADINTALASLKFIAGTALTTGTTPVVSVSAVENRSGLAFNPANNHYYQAYKYSDYPSYTDKSQTAAFSYATATPQVGGQSGYLVTITSAAEDSFVATTIPNAQNIWIGAVDGNWVSSDSNYYFAEGYWGWASPGSPEYGAGFWVAADATVGGTVRHVNTDSANHPTSTFPTGTNYSPPSGSQNITSTGKNGGSSNGFSNWCFDEPNNYDSNRGEHSAVMNWNGVDCWNDLYDTNSGSIAGFVVEYGTSASDGGFTGAAKATSSVYIGPKISISTSPSTSALISTALAQSPSVLLKDSMDTPIPNASITWSALRGTRSAETTTTNSSGIASAGTWTMPANTGMDTLTASVTMVTSVKITSTAYATPPPTGETDTALTLNGSTQVAWAVHNASIDTMNAITVEAWVYLETITPSAWNLVVNKERQFEIGVGTSGLWAFGLNGTSGGWNGVSTTVLAVTQQWHHIALTRAANTNTVNFYLDGTSIYSGSADSAGTGALYSSTDPLTIGGRSSDGSTFSARVNGKIDHVMIFGAVRNSAQIKADMNSYSIDTPTELRAYYDFNEESGTAVYNRASNPAYPNDLTIVNAATFTDVKTQQPIANTLYSAATFTRTYLNSSGGWKVPSGVTKAGLLVVGGGGGGSATQSDTNGGAGGGGGGGGVVDKGPLTLASIATSGVISVVVGPGGAGGVPKQTQNGNEGFQGSQTRFGTISAGGGGAGGSAGSSMAGGSGTSGGGGGGSSWFYDVSTVGNGSAGSAITIDGTSFGGNAGGNGLAASGASNGGAGGGARGAANSSTAGAGATSSISGNSVTYGQGGAAQGVTGYSFSLTPGAPGTGGTGNPNTGASVRYGAYGANGIVIVRWLSATKPIYTPPASDTTTAQQNVTLSVSNNPLGGMTRTFQWYRSLDTGTTYSTISGATLDTYTTATGEQYIGTAIRIKVQVTDTDTYGLSVSDTSTPAIIKVNPLNVISGTWVAKKYGNQNSITYTSDSTTGTGSKTFSASYIANAKLTIDTSTANSIVLTIDSATAVGEIGSVTLIVTDSKGSSTSRTVVPTVLKADTVTVTFQPAVRIYDTTAPVVAESFTVSGLLNGDAITFYNYIRSGTSNSGIVYTDSSTVPAVGSYTYSSINSGSYLSVTMGRASSYENIVFNSSTLTVNRGTPTLSINAIPTSLKYGDTTTVTTTVNSATARSEVQVTLGTSDTSLCSVSGSTLTAQRSVGTCTVTGSTAQTFNWESVTATNKFTTLALADSITVQIGAITPVSYNLGNSVGVTPVITVSGLKNGDTLASTPYVVKYGAGGTLGSTCATGGTCMLGNTGPGGGKVFYVASTPQWWGQYLEAAPSNWVGSAKIDSDASNITKWCVASPSVDSTVFGNLPNGIGQGYSNTYNSSLDQCTGGAIYRARQYRGGGLSDWYVPTKAELEKLWIRYSDNSLITTGGKYYWGSNELIDGTVSSMSNSGLITYANKSDTTSYYLRPIRAFGPTSIPSAYSATAPVNADTYTVQVTGLSLSQGKLANYSEVYYGTSTLRINKIQQQPLYIAQYGGVIGVPYKVFIYGGSGTGAITETATAGTGTPCTLVGDTITSTVAGTCQIFATKAADQNFEAMMASALIYFLDYSNYVSPITTGSGPTIGGGILHPITTVASHMWIDSVGPSGDATYPILISGGGFTRDTKANTSVTFNGPGFVDPNDFVIVSDTQIKTKLAAGSITGRVQVDTPAESSVSPTDYVVP